MNDMVRLHSDHSKVGFIRGITPVDSGDFLYKVFFSATEQPFIPEEDLLGVSEGIGEAESFGEEKQYSNRLDDLRRELLLAKLRTPYGESLFSLRASRVEFHPYQFKPVLKLLYQPDHRLLIADEVGLGKTIEAGIIFTELQARVDMQRILVICPAALRLKWRDEMRSRFEEEFEILDAQRLRDFLDEFQRIGLAARKKAIVSLELARRQEFIERLATDKIHFDLIVIDEAHHIRNRNTKAHELASVVSDSADALLLLTATPLHLGTPDLFHLLQVLSPGEFEDFTTFEEQIEPNRHINAASRYVQINRPEDALASLREVEDTSQRQRFLDDPYYREVHGILSNEKLDRDAAVRAQRALLELNALAHVFTRTKKREVMIDAPIREAQAIRYSFTSEEQAFYDATVKFVRDHWRETQSQPSSVGFALVTRERQAASCLPAFRDHYALAMTEVYSSPEDLRMVEGLVADEDEDEPEFFSQSIADSAKELDAAARGFGTMDTKFDRFLDLLRSILSDDPNAKVLVFSFFKKTLDHLHRRLLHEQVPTALIHGDIDVYDRSPIVEDFRTNDDVRVLLSSEVGSEGLDFQFCHVLINYDLPWNPMKVEQRIGRIDRFGQKNPKVSIYNFIAAGTIEDRIFNRLYSRIRIFEESIGDLEEILGEVMRDLTQVVYAKELTVEQEQALTEQAATAILRRKQEIEEFEDTKDEFLGQDAIFLQDIDQAEASGRYASPNEIRAVVMGYLASEFPRSQLRENKRDDTWHMMPDADFVQALRSFVLRQGRSDYSQTRFLERIRPGRMLPITFADQIAYERKPIEFLTIRHPITRAALAHWKEKATGQPPILVSNLRCEGQAPGQYYFFVFLLKIRAIRVEERLVPLLVSDRDFQADTSMSEQFFRLIQTCEESRPGHLSDFSEASYDKAYQLAVQDMAAMRSRIQDETTKLNGARVNARRFAIEQTFDAKIRRVQESLDRVSEQRIRRMRNAQLENLRVDRAASLEEIEARRDVSVTFSLELSGLVSIASQSATVNTDATGKHAIG